MVGLPARGKTLISQKVCRYLQWLGITTKVFNVGNYRRKLHGAHQLHNFFDPHNPEGERSRREAAVEALSDMIYWFKKEQGVVALYDATNSTRSRREMLLAECSKHNIQVMFIESICQDEALVLHNIMDVKLSSPDYKDMDPEQAAADFKARIVHYEEAYETITEDNLTYIKLINVGSQVIINHIQGYLQSRIVYYLMNLHIAPRSIFFSRHGESLYNVMGKLGGDSDLSARGKQYAKALPLLIATHLGNSEQLTVWTSTMKRTIQTAEHLKYPKLAWKALDELDAGVCDGMTYEEIEEQYPEDFANRDEDKFNYRYRGGESYRDVVVRLEPIIMDLERQRNILIIGHQAILRCIYAYFMNHSHEKLPYIKIPLHTLIQLTPKAYTCEEKRFKVDIEAVDTHRPKPRAGAPKTDAGQPLDHIPTEEEAKPAKDAAITTTTMSTTTFRDSPYSTRCNSYSTIRLSKDNAADPTATPDRVERNRAVQSAFAGDAAAAAAAAVAPASDSAATDVATGGSLSGTQPASCETTPLRDDKSAIAETEARTSLTGVEAVNTSIGTEHGTDPAITTNVQAQNQTPSLDTANTEGSNPLTHRVTRGFDSSGTEKATSESPATTSTGGAPPSNLTIKTQNKPALSLNLKTTATTPPIARVKSDSASLNPVTAWQEGPEYERTAGASPRDPVMSPG
ncbi:Fructose-2,6-bisphosphatase, partial [Podila epigama]